MKRSYKLYWNRPLDSKSFKELSRSIFKIFNSLGLEIEEEILLDEENNQYMRISLNRYIPEDFLKIIAKNGFWITDIKKIA